MSHVLVFIGCYIPGDREDNLFVHDLDLDTGVLHPLSSVGDVRNPAWLDLHPNGRFLYSVCDVDDGSGGSTGALAAYVLDSATGTLQLLGWQPTGGAKPCHVSVHPSGACLLCANYNDGIASVMTIATDFTVDPTTARIKYDGSGPDQDRQEQSHVHSGVFSVDGRYAYFQDLGTDNVWQYRVDPRQGRLFPLEPCVCGVDPGSGPRHMVFHPTLACAYLINELLNTIMVMQIDVDTGQLAVVQTVPTLPAGFGAESYCADIRITSDGRFLYGSNRGHDSLVICSVDLGTGHLTVVNHEPTGGAWPRGFNVDPAGRFVIVANQHGNNVLVFAVDPDTGCLEHTGCTVVLPAPVCVQCLALK